MRFPIARETDSNNAAKIVLLERESSAFVAEQSPMLESPTRPNSAFDAVYRAVAPQSPMLESPTRPNSAFDAVYRAVAPRGGFAGHAFHLRFAPFALSQIVPGAWPFALLLWQGPQEWRIWLTLLLALKVTGGGVLVAAIVSRCFPVIANARGLRARNFWGQAREVAWADICEVRPIRWLFWTSFAKISTPRCRNIVWLPLFLREQSEFEHQVKQWAPPENELLKFFETRAI